MESGMNQQQQLEILIKALEKIRDTAKSWEGRREAPYWNLGDWAAAALKKAAGIKAGPDTPGDDAWLSSIPLRRDIEEMTVPGDWLSPALPPTASSLAIAMLNYGSTHAESWLYSPDLRPDLTLAVGQVVLAVLPALKEGGPKGVIIGKIKDLIPTEDGGDFDVDLIPLACRGPVAEHTGQPLGNPVVVNDFEVYRVLDAANWSGAKGEADNA